MLSYKIDFNCDMGESFGMYKMGFDEEVIKYISSANIACGFHAGDPMWMRRTVVLAESHGVAVGAHPSYPDLNGFGRRNLSADPEEVRNDVVYQASALSGFTDSKTIQHVKPHGAMYNQAVADKELGEAICSAVMEVQDDAILLALSGSQWVETAKDLGMRVGREIFADRAVNDDGTLVSRRLPGSVIHDTEEVVDRSLRMVTEGKVISVNGNLVEVEADSICLHGDTPGAVDMAKSLRSAFEREGIEIMPLAKLV